MPVLVGCVLGAIVGFLTWLVARWYAAGSLPPAVDGAPALPAAPGQRLRKALRGALSWRTLPLAAGMALWGGYLRWRTARFDLLVAALLLTALLLALSLVDFRTRRLPNALLLVLLAWAIAQTVWLGQPALPFAGLGLLVGGGLFLLVALVGRGAMGAGDVKLAAVLGAVLGFPAVVSALLFGTIAGGVAALALLATRRAGRKDFMAYGPYLALGAWLVWTRANGLWP